MHWVGFQLKFEEKFPRCNMLELVFLWYVFLCYLKKILRVLLYINTSRSTNSRFTAGLHGISDTLPYYKVMVTNIRLAIDWKK